MKWTARPQVQRARLSQQVTFAEGTLVSNAEGSRGTLTALRPLQPELGVQFRLALTMYLLQLAPQATSRVPDDGKASCQGSLLLVAGLALLNGASIQRYMLIRAALVRSLWSGLTMPSQAALPSVQIKVVRSMGVPYCQHRGGAGDAVGVRVDSSTAMGVSGLPFMAVKCAAGFLPPVRA